MLEHDFAESAVQLLLRRLGLPVPHVIPFFLIRYSKTPHLLVRGLVFALRHHFTVMLRLILLQE